MLASMRASTISAREAVASRIYHALQVYGVIVPQIAFALTVIGLSAHLGVESNPFLAALFALPRGTWLVEGVRLIFIASVIGQSVYCWRLRHRDRLAYRIGWGLLITLAILSSVDALHDAFAVLPRLLR